MDAKKVATPRKRTGGKNLFKPGIEEEIARLYYVEDEPSRALADQFKGLSKTGRCSASAIRIIAERAWPRIASVYPDIAAKLESEAAGG
jgi:hypothetical protein